MRSISASSARRLDGVPSRLPSVLLQHVQTGRQVWFFNTHNPADTRLHPNQVRWRLEASRVEIALQNQLQGMNLPMIANRPSFAPSMLADPGLVTKARVEFEGGLVVRSHLRMTGRWRLDPRLDRPLRLPTFAVTQQSSQYFAMVAVQGDGGPMVAQRRPVKLGVLQGNYLGIYVASRCAYWNTGDACRFCTTGKNVGTAEEWKKTTSRMPAALISSSRCVTERRCVLQIGQPACRRNCRCTSASGAGTATSAPVARHADACGSARGHSAS